MVSIFSCSVIAVDVFCFFEDRARAALFLSLSRDRVLLTAGKTQRYKAEKEQQEQQQPTAAL